MRYTPFASFDSTDSLLASLTAQLGGSFRSNPSADKKARTPPAGVIDLGTKDPGPQAPG
ncbi:MAG: hypothetical protein NVSMB53_07030 [Gemmatimonadaceae bacterium]